MSACGAGRNLFLQLRQLRLRWHLVMASLEPEPKNVRLSIRAVTLQCVNGRGISHDCQILPGQLIQQANRLRRMACSAGDGLPKMRKGRIDARHQKLAQPVASESVIVVAWVIHPGNTLLRQPLAQLRPR